MKKIIYSIMLSLFVLFPFKVFAEGNISISPSDLTIEQGSSKQIKISAYNAIGDITIKSTDSNIASVNRSDWETGAVSEKQTKTDYITVTGINIGTTTITFTIDAATFDGEDLSGQTKIINVKVVEKSSKPQESTSKIETPKNNLSNNNNIKNISIEGYKLDELGNNNYKLSVDNDITSITVNAAAEDQKAKVTGTGIHELKVGENNIEIIITSESGIQNKFNIKVTRKDGYYLEDLETQLNKTNIKEIDIKINNDSIISKENITKIKNSKKIVKFNYYDENKKLLYSWIIDGKEIKEPKELMTSITNISENIEKISELSNYADGLYINFKHSGELPAGTKIKLYIGDEFKNGNIVNLYQYNNKDKSLSFVQDNLKVIEEYIEFNLEHCSEYFMTMSNIKNKNKVSLLNIITILSLIELLLIIILITFIFIKFKKNNSSNEKTYQ